MNDTVPPASLDLDTAIGAAAVPVDRDGFGADARLVPGTAEHFESAMSHAPKPVIPPPPVPTDAVAVIAKPYLDMLKIAFHSGDRTIADMAVLGLSQKLVAAQAELQILKENT